jgi:hypothetical protein
MEARRDVLKAAGRAGLAHATRHAAAFWTDCRYRMTLSAVP